MSGRGPIDTASRREFLRDHIRHALLAGIAVVTATLIARRGKALPGQTCVNQGVCSGCTVFGNCGLPQALSARQCRRGGTT
jgi:hypothetical protein